MKNTIAFALTASLIALTPTIQAQSLDFKTILDKQFPEERNYVPGADSGFEQYKTQSLRGSGKIVLTFDDGPHPTLTPKLLDILKKYNVKATFFVLTEKLQNPSNREIIKRILREGHIVASHDHDHDNNNNENAEVFRNELTESVQTITDLVREVGSSQNGVYYRFPYGAYGKAETYHHMNIMKEVSQNIFADNCINFAFWDIDSSDWGPTMTPDMIAENVISHVKGGNVYSIETKTTIFGSVKYKIKKEVYRHPPGGGVALLHDIHARSVDAAEILIKKALSLGIEIVPLDTVKEFSYGTKNCRLN
ncbi:MAG: hypothetical protein Fur0010_01800 [Bdellovibrio sp.]